MVAGNAAAANGPTAGAMGLNIDTNTNFPITGKYLMTKDTAVLAGIGLSMRDNGQPTNSKFTDLGIMAGFRKYLKTDDFAPFIGGRFEYSTTRDSTGTVDLTDFGIKLEAGAEYFLAKQFSVEGRVSFGYASQDRKPVGTATSTKSTEFGSASAGLSANFYF